MREGGIGLIIIGLLLAIGALFFPITVSTAGSGYEVVNLGRMQVQSLMFHGGSTLFLAGVVLFAVSASQISIRGGQGVAVDAAEGSREPAAQPEGYQLRPIAAGSMTKDQTALAAKQDRMALAALGGFGALVLIVIITVLMTS